MFKRVKNIFIFVFSKLTYFLFCVFFVRCCIRFFIRFPFMYYTGPSLYLLLRFHKVFASKKSVILSRTSSEHSTAESFPGAEKQPVDPNYIKTRMVCGENWRREQGERTSGKFGTPAAMKPPYVNSIVVIRQQLFRHVAYVFIRKWPPTHTFK